MPPRAWLFLAALVLPSHAQPSGGPVPPFPEPAPWEVDHIPHAEPWIQIDLSSTPPGATVVVSGTVVGTTPWSLRLDGPRSLPLELRRDGYVPTSFTLDAVARGRYAVHARMRTAQAVLDLSALPPGCVVQSGDRILEGPSVQLTPGRHRLTVRRFGYRDVTLERDFPSGQRVILAPEWEPLPWSARALPPLRTRLNPDLGGGLGELRWPFLVSGEGGGELWIVEGGDGAPVDILPLRDFTSPSQLARWRPSSRWSEGPYRAILVLRDPQGQEIRLETPFELTRELRSSPVPLSLDLPPALAERTARWVSAFAVDPTLVWSLGAEMRLPLAGWEASLAVSFHPSPERMAQHARLRLLGPPLAFANAQGWVFWGAQVGQTFTDLALGGELGGLAEGILGLGGLSLWSHSGPYLTTGLLAGWRPVPGLPLARPWLAAGYAHPGWGFGVGLDYDSGKALPLELRSWAAAVLAEGTSLGLGASLRGHARWEAAFHAYLGIDP